MEPVFKFDAEKHVYTLGTQRLPSVTEILGALGFIEDEWFTWETRERGRAVHVASQYLEEGGLDWDSIKATEEALSTPVVPYVRGWERFLRETGWRSSHIEQPAYDPLHFFAGCPDRRGYFPTGGLEGLEIKTGSPQGWWKYQKGGYEKLTGTREWTTVRLKPDGDFSLEPIKDVNAGTKFLSMVTTYRCGREHGIYKRSDE